MNQSPDGTQLTTDGNTVKDPKEKAEIFLEYLHKVHPSRIPNNGKFGRTTKRQLLDYTPNTMIGNITIGRSGKGSTEIEK